MAARSSILWKILVRPSRAMRDAIATKPLVGGFLIFLLAAVSKIGALVLSGLPAALAEQGQLIPLTHYGVLGAWWLISTFLLAATIHWTADLLGGAGRGLALLSCLLLAYLPGMLMAPLTYLGTSVVELPPLLSLLAAVVLPGLWVVWLQLVAVREVYRFGWGKGLGAYILSVAGLGLAGGITLVLWTVPLFWVSRCLWH